MNDDKTGGPTVLCILDGWAQRVTGAPMEPRAVVGEYDPDRRANVSRSELPEGAKEGDHVVVQGPEGGEFLLWIRDPHSDPAVLDGNHPLAGQALTFDIELVEIV